MAITIISSFTTLDMALTPHMELAEWILLEN